jgi:hypothetical protein
MKVIIQKDVISAKGWRREGEIINLEGKELTHYLNKGIAIEYKEQKAEKKETKQAKAPAKRTTKKSS